MLCHDFARSSLKTEDLFRIPYLGPILIRFFVSYSGSCCEGREIPASPSVDQIWRRVGTISTKSPAVPTGFDPRSSI